MGWTTASQDLRRYLSDGPTDKATKRKAIFGVQDGTNKVFETFETRRTTDLSTISAGATSGLGVFVNGTTVTVDSDNLILGEFALHAAPANTDLVVASYYYQWFLDDELVGFLTAASQWLGQADDYTQTPGGLIPAALDFAGSKAFRKIAARWAERWSTLYLLEDAPEAQKGGPVEGWLKQAAALETSADKQRKGFYTRQDQPEAPNFSMGIGHVPSITPQR